MCRLPSTCGHSPGNVLQNNGGALVPSACGLYRHRHKNTAPWFSQALAVSRCASLWRACAAAAAPVSLAANAKVSCSCGAATAKSSAAGDPARAGRKVSRAAPASLRVFWATGQKQVRALFLGSKLRTIGPGAHQVTRGVMSRGVHHLPRTCQRDSPSGPMPHRNVGTSSR